MGLIREPLDVDFVVDPRPLTDTERAQISEYIRKEKHKKKSVLKRRTRKSSSRKKVSA